MTYKFRKLSRAAAPTSSLVDVAQELSTSEVYEEFQPQAAATFLSGWAILWKAMKVTQIGESIGTPKFYLFMPSHLFS